MLTLQNGMGAHNLIGQEDKTHNSFHLLGCVYDTAWFLMYHKYCTTGVCTDGNGWSCITATCKCHFQFAAYWTVNNSNVYSYSFLNSLNMKVGITQYGSTVYIGMALVD